MTSIPNKLLSETIYCVIHYFSGHITYHNSQVQTDMSAEAAAIQHSTQIICDMFNKRRLRPQTLYRSIEAAIITCENNGRVMKQYRDELEIAHKWMNSTNPDFEIPADVLIFRFFRAVPVTRKSKKKMLLALQKYNLQSNKKWKLLPESKHITGFCSTNVKQHIQVLWTTIQKCYLLNQRQFSRNINKDL